MKYNLTSLDKTHIYSFKGCNDEHLKEALKWLKENDKGWDNFTITRFKENSEKYNLVYDERNYFMFIRGQHTALITDLFKEVAAEGDLYQQLEKAQAEVERLQKAIEEESKPKVGDWVYSTSSVCLYKKELEIYQSHERKITNPQLIKLLENESKN